MALAIGRNGFPELGGAERRRIAPGLRLSQSGRFWFSMYSLMIDSGAPPQDAAK